MSDSGKRFADTNVFVYLFDRDAPEKQQRARELVTTEATRLVVSTQVLTEFYVTVTRKLKTALSASDARRALDQLARFDVVELDLALVRRGVWRAESGRLSLWDALVVEAALARQCTQLFTEDLQDGREFEGRLRVTNPFR